MNQARRTRRGTMADVFLLDKQRPYTAERCVPGNACTDDAAAHYNQVEFFFSNGTEISFHTLTPSTPGLSGSGWTIILTSKADWSAGSNHAGRMVRPSVVIQLWIQPRA